jgi:glucose-6-phosphate 1-epimerase
MSFTTALHTYFAVSGIEGVTVEGLSGVTYTDSLAGGAQVVQEGPVIFDREVDRIYLAAPDAAMKVSQGTAVAHKTGQCRTQYTAPLICTVYSA